MRVDGWELSGGVLLEVGSNCEIICVFYPYFPQGFGNMEIRGREKRAGRGEMIKKR